MTRTLILDNGAYAIKAALIDPSNTAEPVKSLVVPNGVGASPSLGRGLVGTTLCALPHYHSLMQRRPLERGLLVDGELQAHVWDAVLARFLLSREDDVDLVLTLPHAAPRSVMEHWSAVLQVAFRFRSVTLVSTALLVTVAAQALGLLPRFPQREEQNGASGTLECCERVPPQLLVLDLGFSHCVATPLLPAAVSAGSGPNAPSPSVWYAPAVENICRVEVGGKLLTNRMKEVLSYTQVNLLEDTWLVNCVKESCCFVAPQGGASHLRRLADAPVRQPSQPPRSAKRERENESRDSGLHDDVRSNSSKRTGGSETYGAYRYVLPTIPSAMPVGVPLVGESGAKLSSDAQVLTLRHERFVIPEALFCPEDLGIATLGLVDAAVRCYTIPGTVLGEVAALRRAAPVHVVVCGGGASMPGVVQRIEQELSAAFSDSPRLASVTSLVSNAEAVTKLYSIICSSPSSCSTAAFRVSVDSLLALCGGVVLFSPECASLLPQVHAIRALVDRRGRVDLLQPLTLPLPENITTPTTARERQPRSNVKTVKAEAITEALFCASQTMV